MANEGSSWHAELDLRVFATLLGSPNGQADIGPEHALGVLTDPRSLPEVVARIHHMVAAGWVDGRRTDAGVHGAMLAPPLKTGLAVWKKDRTLGDTIRQALDDQDAGQWIAPERFIALRDDAIDGLGHWP